MNKSSEWPTDYCEHVLKSSVKGAESLFAFLLH